VTGWRNLDNMDWNVQHNGGERNQQNAPPFLRPGARVCDPQQQRRFLAQGASDYRSRARN
jgi:hypothetical protein